MSASSWPGCPGRIQPFYNELTRTERKRDRSQDQTGSRDRHPRNRLEQEKLAFIEKELQAMQQALIPWLTRSGAGESEKTWRFQRLSHLRERKAA